LDSIRDLLDTVLCGRTFVSGTSSTCSSQFRYGPRELQIQMVACPRKSLPLNH
jgi:hypothetical protein